MNFGDERLPQRFWDRIQPCPMTGCWIWVGWTNDHGYGMTLIPGGRTRVHRVTYQTLVGSVPVGLQLDHLCRVRCCCNPDHLEPVTCSENLRRGDMDRQSHKTECPQGHPYSGSNLGLSPDGYRYCKECKRQKVANYRARKKAA